MSSAVLLDDPPAVFTRDLNFRDRYGRGYVLRPGTIVILPDDAVLVKMGDAKAILMLPDGNEEQEADAAPDLRTAWNWGYAAACEKLAKLGVEQSK